VKAARETEFYAAFATVVQGGAGALLVRGWSHLSQTFNGNGFDLPVLRYQPPFRCRLECALFFVDFSLYRSAFA
jgi:hypothetical protein